MKYQASLPQHNDNVSHEHPLKDFFLILAALLAIAALAFWLLGLSVDWAVSHLSPAAEARLNRMTAISLPESPKKEAARATRVQALAGAMQQCAGLNFRPELRLHTSDVPNAAVVPGGTIIVFTGLLERVQSENGLSFVLAHEMAHIANRDHLRAMGRSIVLFGLSALLTGSDSGLTGLLAPAAHLGTATYSRERESLADARALQILNCRYGHAGGATELFEALKKDADDTSALSHYLASHPSMQSRIQALQRAIASQGMKVKPVLPL